MFWWNEYISYILPYPESEDPHLRCWTLRLTGLKNWCGSIGSTSEFVAAFVGTRISRFLFALFFFQYNFIYGRPFVSKLWHDIRAVFPTYTCNHSCCTIYVRFFVTYTCVLFPSIWPLSYKRAHIQLFRERLSEKKCPRQSRKVIWDIINTLFLTL